MSNIERSLTQNEAPIIRQPRLNLAVGPNCPVRCEGCYNSFGDTFSTGGLVTLNEITDFASEVREREIDGVTLSGGDPLFHPEIVDIVNGLHDINYRIKIDTVGTSLLEDSMVIFKGRGLTPRVDVNKIKDSIESITLPLDGIDQETVEHFRRGRKNIFEETKAIAHLLIDAGVRFGFNTVVHAKNSGQVKDIGDLALSLGAFEWHVFEYDTTGPNPSRQKENLRIEYEEFEVATKELGQMALDGMRLDLRTRDSRTGAGAYFFVNDAGEAWSPESEGLHVRYGHITRDRGQVLASYDEYLDKFRQKFND